MQTIHEHLVNVPQENTLTDVMWRCTSCGRSVGFNREGLGVPFASETEYPEDIDVYIGQECIPALIYIPKVTFYGQFSNDELVAIIDSQDTQVRGLLFKYEQISENGLPINHPLISSGLAYIASLGLLAPNRPDEIIAACMP